MLLHGTPADIQHENLKLSEIVVIECLQLFVNAVMDFLSDEYLRTPTDQDPLVFITEHVDYRIDEQSEAFYLDSLG